MSGSCHVLHATFVPFFFSCMFFQVLTFEYMNLYALVWVSTGFLKAMFYFFKAI